MCQSKIIDFFHHKQGIFIFLIVFLICFSGTQNLRGQMANESYKIRKVVIDAGHGGRDPGTSGKRIKEKDVVLAIALKLGKYIEENLEDVEVIYTRKTDVLIDLYERGNIANKAHADLFISIHANYFPNPKISGTETYVMGLHANDENFEVAKTENAVITFEEDYTTKYEGFDPNSTESYIIFSLLQNSSLEQSLDFAGLVQNQFKSRVNRIDRGVRQAGFIVLWKTTMPSVLIETGYLSNSREEIFLASDTGQDYIASAIFRAFRDYKKKIESKSNFSHILTEPPVLFKVQVSSSRKQLDLNSSLFKKYTDVQEFQVGKWYKYAVGSTGSYEEIVKLQSEVRKDFKDAFVIAFKEDKIIPVSEALKEINK